MRSLTPLIVPYWVVVEVFDFSLLKIFSLFPDHESNTDFKPAMFFLVDGAIHRAAGPELQKECKKLKGCNVGEVKKTAGHNLPAKSESHNRTNGEENIHCGLSGAAYRNKYCRRKDSFQYLNNITTITIVLAAAIFYSSYDGRQCRMEFLKPQV